MMETQIQSTSQIYDQFGMDMGNMEELKEMFLETNIYFLTLTMCVSLLHSIFEILVMKNGYLFISILFLNNKRNTILEQYNFTQRIITQNIVFPFFCVCNEIF